MHTNDLIRKGSRIVSRTYGNVWSPSIEGSDFEIIYKRRRSFNNSIKAALMLVSRGEQVCHIPRDCTSRTFSSITSQARGRPQSLRYCKLYRDSKDPQEIMCSVTFLVLPRQLSHIVVWIIRVSLNRDL